MTRLAALLVVLSWLLHGTMPVTVANAAASPVPVATTGEQAAHRLHSSYHLTVEEDPLLHREVGHETIPACSTFLCFVCATVLPLPPTEIVARNGLFFRIDSRSSPLVASEPVPLERPPKDIG